MQYLLNASRLAFIAICSLATSHVHVRAQELNCQVSVMAPQVSNVEASVFDQLETDIMEFMNGRRWTQDEFTLEERIECSIQITISKAQTPVDFQGSIQVQASRPVYNSDYNAPMFMINDNDFNLSYTPGRMMQYSPDQFRDNLTSVLAFYAYLILGIDYDSFSFEGGTAMYMNAQTVVSNAQTLSNPPPGWSASDGRQSRYALVDNILSQTFRPLRRCYYDYHRRGLDVAYENPSQARKVISDAIIALRTVHRIRPASYNMQTFFLAKHRELVNLFDGTPEGERARILPVLKLIDPGNIESYDNGMG